MSRNKKNVRASLTDRLSIEKMINALQGSECQFEVSLTNYTTSIKFAETGEKYLKTFRSRKCFSAYQKIKKDVKRYLVPDVEEAQVRYFNHDITRDIFVEKAMQIDIKKAYATVLYNEGYIETSTYEYMNFISKQDRLAAVGMLASVKNYFYYEGGKISEHILEQNPLRGFFFYCVKKVEEIMNVCKMEAHGDYLLTWVDAIYIKYNEKLCSEIRRILLYNGFNCEVTVLDNFSCVMDRSKIQVTMHTEQKKKSFFIPHNQNVQVNQLVSFIISSNKEIV